MKRVLFVCIANSGRSQMAEAFFNYFVKGWARAESAGTRPSPRVNPLIVQIMSEVGIDISDKQPKLLTDEMLKQADIVVTMGCEVRAACPATFTNTIDWELEDPSRKPIEVMRRIRDEIKDKVLQLLEELRSAQRALE